MARKLLTTLSVLIILLVSAGVAGAAGKSYDAERFDANWTVEEGGALNVAETVVFNFSGGPFTYVYRELPDDYSDGIEVLGVSLDGRPMQEGSGPGQYELEDSGQKVTWHFAPTSDATHTFELLYQVQGAVRREGGEDLLFWNFLPTDYEYPIASATLSVAYPAAAQLIGQPEVRRGQATTSTMPGEAVFAAKNIGKGKPLTVALHFAKGSLISEPPEWQRHAALVAQRAPTMWLFSALIIALGTLLLIWVWRAGARPDGALPETRRFKRSEPPSNLAPALAGALVNYGAKAGLVQATATLFRLAQMGLLVFEEIGEKKWYRNAQFVVRFDPLKLDVGRLDPHEVTLVDGLFRENEHYDIPMSELSRRLRKVVRPFARAVSGEMVERGLIDKQRAAYASRFVVAGIVLLLLLIPTSIAMVFLVPEFGGWALLVPLVVFLLSMATFAEGAAYSIRSVRGEEEAAAWRGFRDYMKGVTKGSEPNWDLRIFDRYFPYAATFDLAQSWAKAFNERGGAEVPAWFHSVSVAGAQRMGAFVAMTTAAHSVSASGGGAGSGGAGGGGGSGAG